MGSSRLSDGKRPARITRWFAAGAWHSCASSCAHAATATTSIIRGTIGQISQIAGTIAAAIEQQGAATQEISRNVAQAAKGTTDVASNIAEVNRGAVKTGSASSYVLSSAQDLSSQGGKLKQEVANFLATVRAA